MLSGQHPSLEAHEGDEFGLAWPPGRSVYQALRHSLTVCGQETLEYQDPDQDHSIPLCESPGERGM